MNPRCAPPGSSCESRSSWLPPTSAASAATSGNGASAGIRVAHPASVVWSALDPRPPRQPTSGGAARAFQSRAAVSIAFCWPEHFAARAIDATKQPHVYPTTQNGRARSRQLRWFATAGTRLQESRQRPPCPGGGAALAGVTQTSACASIFRRTRQTPGRPGAVNTPRACRWNVRVSECPRRSRSISSGRTAVPSRAWTGRRVAMASACPRGPSPHVSWIAAVRPTCVASAAASRGGESEAVPTPASSKRAA
jgi:hypothetical protein